MYNDLQKAIQEEIELYYEPEEIQKIQERARARADECFEKYTELVYSYAMTDPEDDEDGPSAIYMATFLDHISNLISNLAETQEQKDAIDNAFKEVLK